LEGPRYYKHPEEKIMDLSKRASIFRFCKSRAEGAYESGLRSGWKIVTDDIRVGLEKPGTR